MKPLQITELILSDDKQTVYDRTEHLSTNKLTKTIKNKVIWSEYQGLAKAGFLMKLTRKQSDLLEKEYQIQAEKNTMDALDRAWQKTKVGI